VSPQLYKLKILILPLELASPGSVEAGRRGCNCPPRENRADKGLDVSVDETKRGFWIADDCPLHRDVLGPFAGPVSIVARVHKHASQ
jgi:hypothetical protein